LVYQGSDSLYTCRNFWTIYHSTMLHLKRYVWKDLEQDIPILHYFTALNHS